MTDPGAAWSAPSPAASSAVALEAMPAQAAPVWSPSVRVVPLRPLGIGELLDGSVKIMRRNPRTAYALSAGLAAIVTIVNVLVLVLFVSLPDVNSSQDLSASLNQGISNSGAELPAYAIEELALLVLTGILATLVSRVMLRQSTTLADVRTAVRPRFWALVGLSLLTLLIVAAPVLVVTVAAIAVGPAGLILLLPAIPASIYLYVRLALAPPALVMENASIRTALRRSGVLLKGSFWRVLGVRLLGFLIGRVIQSVLAIPPTIVIEVLYGGHVPIFGLVIIQVFIGLAQVIVLPFTAGVRSLLYVDQRMRLEGLDLALQSAARG